MGQQACNRPHKAPSGKLREWNEYTEQCAFHSLHGNFRIQIPVVMGIKFKMHEKVAVLINPLGQQIHFLLFYGAVFLAAGHHANSRPSCKQPAEKGPARRNGILRTCSFSPFPYTLLQGKGRGKEKRKEDRMMPPKSNLLRHHQSKWRAVLAILPAAASIFRFLDR